MILQPMSKEESLVATYLVGLTTPPTASGNTMADMEKVKVRSESGKRTGELSSEKGEGGKKKRVKKKKEMEHVFPVEPRVIQVIKRPKTYMDHSYRDFSAVSAELDHVEPENIDDMTFAQKVHHILSQSEYNKCMAWAPHGRTYRIVLPKRLEQMGILKKYFGHNRFSSFLRQLNNYGFKHISQGPDRNCYYHELMLRGLPHLAKYMPEIKDARRLIPDPESEPDFESISKVFPLPDAQAAALELALSFQNNDASIMGGSGLQQQFQNNDASVMGGSGLQQQFQSATNNNWASIPQMFPAASSLERSQACDTMRANNAVSAALHREAEVGAQEQQNVAMLIELAARRQQQADFDAREQQANPGNAALALLMESMVNPPNQFGYQ